MSGISEIDQGIAAQSSMECESAAKLIWMRRVLMLAAAYDLIWGPFAMGWTILTNDLIL